MFFSDVLIIYKLEKSKKNLNFNNLPKNPPKLKRQKNHGNPKMPSFEI